MNKFTRVLFLGAFIPYAILLIYYITRWYFSYFLILSLYIISTVAKLTHRQYLEKSILAWVRVQRVCELALISSFALRNVYNNGIIALCAVSTFVALLIKMPRRMQKNIENEAVYVTICMCFFTNADSLGKLSTMCLCILKMYEPQAKLITSHATFDFAIESRLKQYHCVCLFQIYALFIMEYTLTRVNIWGFVLIGTCVAIYNAYAYFTLPHDSELRITEYYMSVSELPKNYPIPLNVKDAISECDIAKKVFKTHSI